MPLLDLPSELLGRILDFTLPSGIESFAISCKTVYRHAKNQIRRHNALEKKWKRTINVDINHCNDTLHILYEISRDSLVAHYIEHLSLGNRFPLYRDDPTTGTRDPGFRVDENAMQRVKEMVTGIELLANVADMEQWWEKILLEDEVENENEGDGLCAFVSLLFLLPNLKTLKLPPDWNAVQLRDEEDAYQKDLVLAIDAIVESKSTPGREQPLRNLETIYPFMAEGYEERGALQCLQPFMALPNLRNLYAVSCIAVEDGYTGLPFRWRGTMQSPLRRLELAYSCMDAEGLAALVSHTPQLEVFRYSHQTKWHGCQHDWNPGEFVEALSRHCGQTITELALTIDELYGDVENGVSHLRSFPKLRLFEADVRIFCGPPVESGQRLGEQAILKEGERAWTREDIPCIGEMLPESIEEVHINTDYPTPDETALRLLLKNVKKHKATRLFKWETLIIRQYEGDSALILNGPELTFDIFNRGGSEPRLRHMMPLWKRQFETAVGGIEFITQHMS
jgi:hypothetical protein